MPDIAYTHVTKNSRQRCFQACWWPISGPDATYYRQLEQERPLMHLESGQITSIRQDNLRKLK